MNLRRYLEQRWRTASATAALVAALAALLAGTGWVLGGPWGAAASVALSLFGAWVTRGVSPAMAMRLQRAVPIAPWQAPELHRSVVALARRAGLPRAPRLYLARAALPQAFAIGSPDESAIAVSPALLGALPHEERVAVLAHEIAHVRNRDSQLLLFANVIRAALGTLVSVGWVLVALVFLTGRLPVLHVAILAVLPLTSLWLVQSVSRARELAADADAARLCNDPMALASALRRIEELTDRVGAWLGAPGFEPPRWLRSHPTTDERVAALASLSLSRHVRAVPTPTGFRAAWRDPRQSWA